MNSLTLMCFFALLCLLRYLFKRISALRDNAIQKRRAERIVALLFILLDFRAFIPDNAFHDNLLQGPEFFIPANCNNNFRVQHRAVFV